MGKSSIVNVFIRNAFISDSAYMPTIIDSFRTQIMVEGESCLLEIIDTAGDALYSSLTEDQLKKGDGFLCVFGVNDGDSFEQTNTLIKKVHLVKRNNPAILLVGNKCDEATERKVDSIRGEARASHYGIPYVETSALNGINIKEAFSLVVRLIRLSKHIQASSTEDRQCCTIC